MNTQNLVVQKEKVEERLDGSLGLGCDGLVNGNQIEFKDEEDRKNGRVQHEQHSSVFTDGIRRAGNKREAARPVFSKYSGNYRQNCDVAGIRRRATSKINPSRNQIPKARLLPKARVAK